VSIGRSICSCNRASYRANITLIIKLQYENAFIVSINTMAISKLICVAELRQEINIYWLAVITSLGLTALSVCVWAVCFRSKFDGAPGLGAQYFYVTGTSKVLMGALIAGLYHPSCPANCSLEVCESQNIPSPLYPFLATLVGLLWLKKGYELNAKAQALENGESQGGEDTTFQEVSTVEIS